MDETAGLAAEATPTQMTLEREVIEGDRTYHITATAMPDGRTAICFLSGPVNSPDLNELSGIIAKEDLVVIARAFKPELTSIAAWHGISLDDRASRIGDVRRRHPNAFAPWTAEQEQTLLELHRAGTPRREIAKQLGRPIGGVHRRLEKLGILT